MKPAFHLGQIVEVKLRIHNNQGVYVGDKLPVTAINKLGWGKNAYYRYQLNNTVWTDADLIEAV